jgi:Ca2+-binding RTX toxin-like protein
MFVATEVRGGVMRVESVGGAALGFTKPKTMRSVLIASTLTITTGITVLLSAPTAHARVIDGTAAADTIVGTRHGDRIRGRAGDDEVSARGGPDDVLGGPGDDVVKLGPGNDTAHVGGHDGGIGCFCGADTIIGGRGGDLIIQGNRPDRLFGNRGDDEIWVSDGDLARGGPGDDHFRYFPFNRPVRINCGPGTDTVLVVERVLDPKSQLIDCERRVAG